MKSLSLFNPNHQPSQDIIEYALRNEVGDAELFAEIYTDQVAYDHADKKWYIWKKQYWEEDRTGRVYIAMNLVANLYKQGADQLDDKESADYKLLMNRYMKLLTKQRIKNVLDIASHLPSIRLTGDEWNLPPFLLPVANGILDLTTGNMRKGTPNEYIKDFSQTAWLGLDSPAPEWEKFIAAICDSDPELISFLQRLLGYAITGDIREQVLLIFNGEGSNGKSTLMDTLSRVLGDAFCFPTQADSLMDTRSTDGDGPRPFVCALRNKRPVWASESQEGQRLNTGLVKQLTGDQNITARNLYSKPITFKPSHKIFLITNSLPNLPDGSDYAIIRRLIVFPFNKCFVDNPKLPNQLKRDKYILEKLQKEGPGILTWLVKGTIAWLEQGLNPPESCKIATDNYRKNEDSLGQYITNNLLVGDTFEIQARYLYDDYRQWCNDNGYDPLLIKTFGQRITRLYGAAKVKSIDGKSYKIYKGFGLVSNQP